MTQREKELTEALALLVQKSERLCDSISELEEGEKVGVAVAKDEDIPPGSEPYIRAATNIRTANSCVRGNRIILQAAVREAKDTLYPELKRAVA